MKNYQDYPYASMSMSSDIEFKKELKKIFSNYKITTIIESGTYTGEGSTSTLLEIIKSTKAPVKNFYTIEVNLYYYLHAKNLFRNEPIMHCLNGLSVNRKEAKEFILNDSVLDNHKFIEDVFIDNIENPKLSYLNELKGKWNSENSLRKFLETIYLSLKLGFNFEMLKKQKDNILVNLLSQNKEKFPLIILDSAGGIGLLEFNTVSRTMEDKPFLLILDDIHHIKHFRSYNYIKESNEFEILHVNLRHGRLIALKK